ncbi:MAG: metallophosphoesterase [Bdellovibrionota bacterium]
MAKIFIREEKINLSVPCRFTYLSDFHFSGFTSSLFIDQIIYKVKNLNPSFILLGGDLVDHRTGLIKLKLLISKLTVIAPVLAISGNHDDYVGKNNVSKIVIDSGGSWIENSRKSIKNITIDGSIHKNPPKNTILCSHNPNIFPKAVAAGYKIIIAGHLHGGQIVLWQLKKKLYPAAFFYKWNGTRFENGTSTMIVSRGLNDTIPIRWNCPREIILCAT